MLPGDGIYVCILLLEVIAVLIEDMAHIAAEVEEDLLAVLEAGDAASTIFMVETMITTSLPPALAWR